MKRLAAFAILCTFAVSAVAASPPVVRKAPEFTIVEPDGKQTLLSSYRGKVVVMEFLLTWCQHCQHTAEMITKVYKDLGPRGFQPIGVAFSENPVVLVPPFVKQFGIPFPVGYTNQETLISYFGFSVMDRIMAPQMVVIDRKGMIRAQSPPSGDPNLQDETKLREMIDELLKEGAPRAKR